MLNLMNLIFLNINYLCVNTVKITKSILKFATLSYNDKISTLKCCGFNIVSKSIDMYVELKWYFKSGEQADEDNKDEEVKKNIPVWDFKNSDYGIYRINKEYYLSFKLDKDLSQIDFNDGTEILNIKIFKKESDNPNENETIIKETIKMCCGPNFTFPCGIPTLNELRKFKDEFADVTKIIVNMTNYEEYVIT
jgi:hypothetical protein